MVILLRPRLELGSDGAQLVLVLAKLSLIVDELRLDIALLDALQVHLLRQQVDLILLLRGQLVVRLLNKLELLVDDLELTLHLVTLRLQ